MRILTQSFYDLLWKISLVLIILINVIMTLYLEKKVEQNSYTITYLNETAWQLEKILYATYNFCLLIILVVWMIIRAPLLISKQRNREFQQLRQKLASMSHLSNDYQIVLRLLKRSYLNLNWKERQIVFSLYSFLDDFKRPLNSFQVSVNNLGLIIRDSEFKFIQFLVTCGIFALFNDTVIIFQALPLLAIIVRSLAEEQDTQERLPVNHA